MCVILLLYAVQLSVRQHSCKSSHRAKILALPSLATYITLAESRSLLKNMSPQQLKQTDILSFKKYLYFLHFTVAGMRL